VCDSLPNAQWHDCFPSSFSRSCCLHRCIYCCHGLAGKNGGNA
jgi:hypothetical protein